MRRIARQGWRQLALLAVIWTVLALIEAVQTYHLSALLERPLPLGMCVLLAAGIWYGLGVLSPLLVWLAVLLMCGLGWAARFTRIGRNLYALGSSAESAP